MSEIEPHHIPSSSGSPLEHLSEHARKIFVHEFKHDGIAHQPEYLGKPLGALALNYTIDPSTASHTPAHLLIEPMNLRHIDASIVQTPVNTAQDVYFRSHWNTAQRVEDHSISPSVDLAHLLPRRGGVFFHYRRGAVGIQSLSQEPNEYTQHVATRDMILVQTLMSDTPRPTSSIASHTFSIIHDPRVPLNGSETEAWLNDHAAAMHEGLDTIQSSIEAMQTSRDPDVGRLAELGRQRRVYLLALRALGFEIRLTIDDDPEED